MGYIVCPKCGKKNPDSARACLYCKTNLRENVQSFLKKDLKQLPKKWRLTIFGIFLIGVLFLVCIPRGPERKPAETPSSSTLEYVDLNASVKFTETQFIITNRDNFDWTNVELDVNSGIVKSGYVLKTQRMKAGEVYTVGAMQFAKGDGTRLNPFTTKVLNLSISCDTPGGHGFWKGSYD